MIARIWHGTTHDSKADDYLEYVRRTGVEAHRSTRGNRGDLVLRRVKDGRAEFLVISLWDSLDAVRAFAGPDPEKSVYYPEDDRYLLEREPHVLHYEVLIAPSPGDQGPVSIPSSGRATA